MNNKGREKRADFFRELRIQSNKIKSSYAYKLFSRFFSFLCTLILVFLLVIGALLFYFNAKSKSYESAGKKYIPPFGLYTIVSGSMEPNVKVYDVVVAVNVNDLSKIKTGDIITFISTWDVNYGLTITHRVVGVARNDKGEYQFTTKGDNNQTPDGSVVTRENLIGKVVLRIPQLGRLQFFLSTKMGWFIIVLLPALCVIIYDLIKIFKLAFLKNRLENVVDAKEADKIYFGNETLETRMLPDDALDKTRRIIVREEHKIEENNEDVELPLMAKDNKTPENNINNNNRHPLQMRKPIQRNILKRK